MIIEIALGILLGFVLILALPYILIFGIWAILIAIALAVLALVLFNLGAIGGFILEAIPIALLLFCFFAFFICIGYLAYYSKYLVNSLHLGMRPTIGSKGSKFVQYKELCIEYMTVGMRIGIYVLIIFGILAVAYFNIF